MYHFFYPFRQIRKLKQKFRGAQSQQRFNLASAKTRFRQRAGELCAREDQESTKFQKICDNYNHEKNCEKAEKTSIQRKNNDQPSQNSKKTSRRQKQVKLENDSKTIDQSSDQYISTLVKNFPETCRLKCAVILLSRKRRINNVLLCCLK